MAQTHEDTALLRRVLALLRGMRYGELRLFLHGGTIVRIERTESIKPEDLAEPPGPEPEVTPEA